MVSPEFPKTLSKESFEEFIEQRLEIIRLNMQEVTGKSIEKADGKFEKK